ncbi:MAG: hypothetical protein ACK4SM_04620 [Aquificaceae bacterium]
MLYVLPSSSVQSNIVGTLEGHDAKFNNFIQLNQKRKEILGYFNLTCPCISLWRRFKNRFWDHLQYWVLPKSVKEHIKVRSIVLSPAFGILSVEDTIPRYSLTWNHFYKGVRLKEYWKKDIREITKVFFESMNVLLFVGKSEMPLVDTSRAKNVVIFEYYRKDKKVKNPLPHRAYTLRYIAERGIDMDGLYRINFYNYSVYNIVQKDKLIRVVLKSPGEYI